MTGSSPTPPSARTAAWSPPSATTKRLSCGTPRPLNDCSEFDGHAAPVLSVDFSADGSEIYTSGADGSVIVWDLDRTRGLARELVPSAGPDQARARSSSAPPTDSVLLGEFTEGPATEPFHLLDVQSGTLTDLRVDGMEPRWGAYGPDGRTVAMVSADGEVRLWDVATAELLATQPGRGADNWGAIAFTADGDHIVVADADGTASVPSSTRTPSNRRDERSTSAPSHTASGQASTEWSPSRWKGRTSATGTEVVFADLDEGSVLHRLQAPGAEGELQPRRPALRLRRVRRHPRSGRRRQRRARRVRRSRPHGPAAWVTFSPDRSDPGQHGRSTDSSYCRTPPR